MNDGGVAPNRALLTCCVILAVIMQALDTTIANVALPYMQGSVSASADQINWVLTSYIVAAAIMTQPSAFLARRFGRKRVLLSAIVGFVITSILCGLAQTLEQIILFRLLQGLAGAALVPLSQGIMLDSYSLKERGSAMALFGVSVMVGPVLGPVLGGWLTEHLNWRWVFFINLPIGLLAFVGLMKYVRETTVDRETRLDWLGFGSLSVAILAFQLLLDRGEHLDWFSSGEILLELVVALVASYVFLVHMFTADKPFISPSLFKDRNFALGVVFIFIIGITYLASLALMTPYLQKLMGYPVLDAGLAMGPRGLGTMLTMFLAGQIIGKVDTRWLLFTGLLLSALSMHWMSGWTPDVSMHTLIAVGFVQGASLGLLFVPLNTIAFATLDPKLRADGTGLFSLSRNVGSSVGISLVTVLLTRNTQVLHEEISGLITPFNRALESWAANSYFNPAGIAGRTLLDQTITHQATSMAYLNDFRLLMLLAIAVMPLLLLMRPSGKPDRADDEAMVLD
ncbi:DHA2 family efflux MFS transporter permease subunit [Pseudomonas sp. GD03860]|uniref:DHA2 family efflux MFS transporter permease subunit n=1 Tax=Pseudomonas TaxID=286 RepID=UPI002363A0D8|nr:MULTISPECIES: DHA2 family efflux MFS transporter permease subunit [Pseudomonas]MDD2058391.1 DHA2 family efflux MFS transporter permease subunit [Pseudomonas putida]MDH0636321.1 DHA2 family efflux MFS transporter permease subunit [Pseudomonas sp. GD03860]